MAILEKFYDLWWSTSSEEKIIPAPPTTYEVRPLTLAQLDETIKLDHRCFTYYEVYTRATMDFLLSAPNGLSYRAVMPNGMMVGFVIALVDDDGVGHITAIAVAPEHRQRGLASKLLKKAEDALRWKNISMVRLEVREANNSAQRLYRQHGYCVMQRLEKYYSNGGDALMMVKSLV